LINSKAVTATTDFTRISFAVHVTATIGSDLSRKVGSTLAFLAPFQASHSESLITTGIKAKFDSHGTRDRFRIRESPVGHGILVAVDV
jgi:hypothetical protein